MFQGHDSLARVPPAADSPVGNSVGAIECSVLPGGTPPGSAGWACHRPLSTCYLRLLRGLPLGGLAVFQPVPRGDVSYLVDSASSHMLVSKIKPCMSKYKQSIR